MKVCDLNITGIRNELFSHTFKNTDNLVILQYIT